MTTIPPQRRLEPTTTQKPALCCSTSWVLIKLQNLYIRKCSSLTSCPKIFLTRSRVRTYVSTIKNRALYQMSYPGTMSHLTRHLSHRHPDVPAPFVQFEDIACAFLSRTSKYNTILQDSCQILHDTCHKIHVTKYMSYLQYTYHILQDTCHKVHVTSY